MEELISTAGFRCPSCGQTHEMRTAPNECYTMNNEMTNMSYNGDDVISELEMLPSVSAECPECNEANDFANWARAFKEPLVFFETENLCHCGGELWMDQIPGTRNYGFVCDDCNWVKPKAVVSGA